MDKSVFHHTMTERLEVDASEVDGPAVEIAGWDLFG
jgi:hypothetical protein